MSEVEGQEASLMEAVGNGLTPGSGWRNLTGQGVEKELILVRGYYEQEISLWWVQFQLGHHLWDYK